jgi:hypothetical protein
MLAGTPVRRFTPRMFASIVVQGGVGIARART